MDELKEMLDKHEKILKDNNWIQAIIVLSLFGKNMTKEKWNSEIIAIDLITRQLQIFIDDEYYRNYTESDTLDFIYDLIKANLVVKVEE